MFESFFKMLGLHPKPIVVPVHPHLANTVSHAPVHTPIHAPVMANTSPVVASASRTPTAGPTISVVNLSTVVTDAEVETAVAAIQIQVDRDFAPIWNMPANLVFVPKTATVPATSWVLQVLDNSDQAGALGYHELNTTEVPLAKIFAKTDLENNLSWSVTMSHEILEMIGDPYVDISVFVQTTATEGYLFAFEMCDAVEDDSIGYKINDVLVSDFVLPPFYETGAVAGAKFDFCGHLTAPLSIAPGGYMSIFPVNPTTKGWTQQTGAEGAGKRLQLKGPHRRKAKRSDRFKPKA